MQAVIYLIFNEGYLATSGDSLVRRELCAEAIRLARLLRELYPQDAETAGLLALMLLHDSRRHARVDASGALVTLEEQDRGVWDREEIDEGLALVDFALNLRAPGAYQIQAAIGALHAQAATPAETDWPQIAALYAELAKLNPSPVVLLNRAVAIGMSEGPERGLMLMDSLGVSGALSEYYLLHAARADHAAAIESPRGGGGGVSPSVGAGDERDGTPLSAATLAGAVRLKPDLQERLL